MRTARDGFTFVELLLVLVMGMILLGAVYDTMVKQERAYGMLSAVAGTQQDTRLGIDILAAELRELSVSGGDLLMASGDSIRLRAQRKFGIVCLDDKSTKKFSILALAAEPFAPGDSFHVYVDQDSLKATDDIWQKDVVSSTSTLSTCGTSALSLALGLLFPGGTLQLVTVPGAGLRFDSIYPGAPIRSFEHLTYRRGTLDGEIWLERVRADTITPVIGPVAETNGFKLSYYDTLGTALTSLPLSAADRARVHRVRLELRATRKGGTAGTSHTDSLITDIYLRGS